ncbi:MAG: DUF3127 domain-containing protein [Prevotellaceae bacterium]|jgi:hypothetical protein|nr:DUF3127 domain-containing protein [Prevotellaceae bacterium]
MELKAKLIQLLPLQTGEGRNGPWKKQDFIVETDGQYPRKVCFSIWGDKVNPSILAVGNTLNVSFEAESREFNGRWYTDLRAWKIDLIDEGATSSSSAAAAAAAAATPQPQAEASPQAFASNEDGKDDLPF